MESSDADWGSWAKTGLPGVKCKPAIRKPTVPMRRVMELNLMRLIGWSSRKRKKEPEVRTKNAEPAAATPSYRHFSTRQRLRWPGCFVSPGEGYDESNGAAPRVELRMSNGEGLNFLLRHWTFGVRNSIFLSFYPGPNFRSSAFRPSRV